MNADQLIKEFGLQMGSDVGSGFNAGSGATDGDKTKSNSLLGDGYLSDDVYNDLKNSDKVKSAYAAVNGQEAADNKFKDGGLSINTLDSLFDSLTASKEESTSTSTLDDVQPEFAHSPKVAHAKARLNQWKEDVMSGRTGTDLWGGGDNQDAAGSFLDRYKLKLGEKDDNGNYFEPEQ